MNPQKAVEAAVRSMSGEVLFVPDTVVMSDHVERAVAASRMPVEAMLERHFRADWGLVAPELSLRSDVARRSRGRVIGLYASPGIDRGVRVVIETDLATRTTSLLMMEEWMQREKDSPAIREEPAVRHLLRQEAETGAKLDQVSQALDAATAELDEVRRVESSAAARRDRFVIDEVTGAASAAERKDVEKELARAHARVSMLEERCDILRRESTILGERLDALRAERTRLEAAASADLAVRDRQLARSIADYDADAAEFERRYADLLRLLERIRARQEHLAGMGAEPNPRFLEGYGRSLEASIQRQPDIVAREADPWRAP